MPIMVQCPSCQRQLRVPDDLLGRSVRCPGCQTTFPAQQEAGIQATPAPQPPPFQQQPAFAPPPESEPWGSLGEYNRVDKTKAKSAVSGPAIALMIVSGLTLALAGLSLVANMALPILMENQGGGRPGGPGPDPAFQAATGVMGAIIGLIWGGLIFAGALNMMRLQNYGLAMAGAITAMVPCNLCCILGLPFGIWALVVLNQPEVKGSFT